MKKVSVRRRMRRRVEGWNFPGTSAGAPPSGPFEVSANGRNISASPSLVVSNVWGSGLAGKIRRIAA